MKIAYCIAGTWNAGGMERVLANKVNALTGCGYEVHIITTDQRGQKPFFKMDDRVVFHDLGVNYDSNNGGSLPDKILRYPVKQMRHFCRLSKLLKELKADIVVSMFNNDASFIPRIHDGSRKILEIHFSRLKRQQYDRKGLWAFIDKFRSATDIRTVSRYDRFVVLTEEDRKNWGELKNMRVIPNASSFTFDTPAALENRQVIAVGRFNYQKGFDRLIDAWSLLPRNGWKLKIVGGGELYDDLRARIDKLGLSDSITLGQPTSGMMETYSESSMLVLSSHYEGLPMVLIEAQSAGLPIVSFACKCGPRDVVTDGRDGFLVREGDIRALAEKIRILQEDEALRKEMGAAAFEASARYSTEKIMALWKDLFEGRL